MILLLVVSTGLILNNPNNGFISVPFNTNKESIPVINDPAVLTNIWYQDQWVEPETVPHYLLYVS